MLWPSIPLADVKTVQINNPMVLFGLLVCLATASYGASEGGAPASDGFENCVLQSSVDPNAEMRWHLPSDSGSPIGLWRGVLVQGGEVKVELTASRSLAPSRPTAWRRLQMWMAFSSLAWDPTFITAANARIEH